MASTAGGPSSSHILEEELSKIRPHVNSKLPHQKAPAQLLIALESTLTAQDSSLTPVAYFAALVTTLEQSIRREEGDLNLDEGAMTPAILYLLALVLPSIPTVVIRSHLPTALPILAPLFPKLLNHAPPLRSQLSIFAVIIPGLDTSQLSTPNLRQSFASILELTVDPRPKVRKKAQEVIYAVLSSPPPPTVKHPYADQVANFVLGVLNAVDGTSSRGKNAKPTDTIEVGIWCCTFVKTIASFWPSTVRVLEI